MLSRTFVCKELTSGHSMQCFTYMLRFSTLLVLVISTRAWLTLRSQTNRCFYTNMTYERVPLKIYDKSQCIWWFYLGCLLYQNKTSVRLAFRDTIFVCLDINFQDFFYNTTNMVWCSQCQADVEVEADDAKGFSCCVQASKGFMKTAMIWPILMLYSILLSHCAATSFPWDSVVEWSRTRPSAVTSCLPKDPMERAS